MMLSRSHAQAWAVFVLLICAVAGGRAAGVKLGTSYVFTDERAVITLDPAPTAVPYSVKTITVDGWGPAAEGTATVIGGRCEIPPLTEGLHIVTLHLEKPCEVRFLAMAPPPAVTQRDARRCLPLAGKKLFSHQPYTLLAMGDSVTNTGDYAGMLARLLTRATGNTRITVYNHSYPGRSVDASVRFFARDIVPKPDLALVMYGLNDQAAACALDGYIAQYRWLAEQIAGTCHGDTVLLTPTPDLSTSKDATAFSPYLLRTFGFAEAVCTLAQTMHLPCADTFQALWGRGGASLDATGKAMQVQYPWSYSKQFTSALEQGSGDGIHPGALGHLQMAKAAFRAMMGLPAPAQPLTFAAVSAWEKGGLVSQVTLRNTGKAPRSGRCELYPVPDGAVQTSDALTYALAPGAQQTFTVTWPQIQTPQDLLKFPTNQYITPYQPIFSVLDLSGATSHLYVVTAPMVVDANYVRERQVVNGQTVQVKVREGRRLWTKTVTIPAGSEVGRIPLIHQARQGGHTGWTAAEVAYVRFGSARPGDAVVDGDLKEWDGHTWSTVGEPVQARWTQGVNDRRATPRECYLRWAFNAGTEGVFLAMKAIGSVQEDTFTLFFDPRPAALLGTPGRYYWVSGSLKEGGQVKLSNGETSPRLPIPQGKWQATADGLEMECFIPYAIMDSTAWPADGDLGLSIWWQHHPADGGRPMHLQWSEDAHPWNTRWYGVVRREQAGDGVLPYVVHVK